MIQCVVGLVWLVGNIVTIGMENHPRPDGIGGVKQPANPTLWTIGGADKQLTAGDEWQPVFLFSPCDTTGGKVSKW